MNIHKQKMKLNISIPIELHDGGKPFVRFKAGDGTERVALLDTGAATSLFDRTSVEGLAGEGLAELEDLDEAVPFHGLGNGECVAAQCASLPVAFPMRGDGTAGATFMAHGVVLDLRRQFGRLCEGDGRCVGLFGMDFMSSAGMRLDFGAMECAVELDTDALDGCGCGMPPADVIEGLGRELELRLATGGACDGWPEGLVEEALRDAVAR